jgi:hypothetical protein
MGDTTPVDRKRTAKSFCSTATVLTVTGGIGVAAADAPLAGAAGADAAALAGVALVPVVPAPAGASSLLPQALSKITDRLKQRLAFRNEFERVFFILK